jgi:hypothetical protein
MLTAGFKPTPRETDFDSVVVTTWLRPDRRTSEETIDESMAKVCSDRKRPIGQQVSNPHFPRETDFYSVMVTSWLRPVKRSL